MSTETGRLAEMAAAGYLINLGFAILACNHRTRWSELDIVAERLLRGAAAWSSDHRYAGAYSIDVIAAASQPGSFELEWLEQAVIADR